MEKRLRRKDLITKLCAGIKTKIGGKGILSENLLALKCKESEKLNLVAKQVNGGDICLLNFHSQEE